MARAHPPLIGRTTNRASTCCRKDSRLISRWMCPLLTSVANSKSVISGRWPNRLHFHASHRLRLLLFGISAVGQRPAKRQHGCQQESFEFAPVFGRKRRRNHIARNRTFAFQKIVDFARGFVDRNKLRYRLAMFSDYNRLALGLNLVHDGKTICFEGARCHLFHFNLQNIYSHYTMVISVASEQNGREFTAQWAWIAEKELGSAASPNWRTPAGVCMKGRRRSYLARVVSPKLPSK